MDKNQYPAKGLMRIHVYYLSCGHVTWTPSPPAVASTMAICMPCNLAGVDPDLPSYVMTYEDKVMPDLADILERPCAPNDRCLDAENCTGDRTLVHVDH